MTNVMRESDQMLFSVSDTERQIEINFVKRLSQLLRERTVDEIQQWAVSGEFNRIFSVLYDETSPVPEQQFKDLKPFDYSDWARRNLLKD